MTRSHDGVVGRDVEIAELTAAMCDPKAAVTQIRSDTPGRVSFDKKMTERKTNQVALRSLKRRISRAGLPTTPHRPADKHQIGPGGNLGTSHLPTWPASHPDHRLFGSVTSGHPQNVRAGLPNLFGRTAV